MTEDYAFLARAHTALSDARLLLDHARVEAMINRTYYAAFYAATAALHQHGERPKTHSGTLYRFQVRFVDAGRLEQRVATALGQAFHARQHADYDAISIYDEAAARDLLADVERFVAAVEVMLETP